MSKCNPPKDKAKNQPGKKEGGREDEQQVAPAYVHAGGKNVCQIAPWLVLHVVEDHVALAVLLHKAAAEASCAEIQAQTTGRGSPAAVVDDGLVRHSQRQRPSPLIASWTLSSTLFTPNAGH